MCVIQSDLTDGLTDGRTDDERQKITCSHSWVRCFHACFFGRLLLAFARFSKGGCTRHQPPALPKLSWVLSYDCLRAAAAVVPRWCRRATSFLFDLEHLWDSEISFLTLYSNAFNIDSAWGRHFRIYYLVADGALIHQLKIFSVCYMIDNIKVYTQTHDNNTHGNVSI